MAKRKVGRPKGKRKYVRKYLSAINVMQALYASEINCKIECFWDGGWTARLGDNMNGFLGRSVTADTLDECLTELAGEAIYHYAQSGFADWYFKQVTKGAK